MKTSEDYNQISWETRVTSCYSRNCGVLGRERGLEGQFHTVKKTSVGAYEVPCTLQGKMDSKEGEKMR